MLFLTVDIEHKYGAADGSNHREDCYYVYFLWVAKPILVMPQSCNKALSIV